MWKKLSGKMIVSVLGISILILGFFFCRALRTADVQIIKVERVVMGTTWLVQLALTSDEPVFEAEKAVEEVFRELSRIDQVMSEWKEDSPVSAINAAAGRRKVRVPEELRLLIERAVAFGELTGGAFDITWKGLAPLWRFDDTFSIPDEDQIQQALKLVDFRKIEIDGNCIGLSKPGMALGLGGIAKGYAIDRSAAVLLDKGYRNFLVNGGGDVLTAGTRGGRPWRIGVRAPRGSKTQLVARLELSGGAVVTSGDYERYRIVNGVRYHHILDPRTGHPARKCQSVTIVAPSAEQADALATAVFVQGPVKGMQLVSTSPKVEALVIDASGESWMTEGFEQLVSY